MLGDCPYWVQVAFWTATIIAVGRVLGAVIAAAERYRTRRRQEAPWR